MSVCTVQTFNNRMYTHLPFQEPPGREEVKYLWLTRRTHFIGHGQDSCGKKVTIKAFKEQGGDLAHAMLSCHLPSMSDTNIAVVQKQGAR